VDRDQVDREYVEVYPLRWESISKETRERILQTRSIAQLKDISIYIHIPFCPVICPFCTFNKRLFNNTLYHKYVDALRQEILLYKGHPDFADRKITAIYFGGGTGSMLTPNDANEILSLIEKNFPVAREAEITMECYPTTIDYHKLMEYRNAGINRISIGVQSFSKANLKIIGRGDSYHSNKDVIIAALEAGYGKVGVDLMYRFPNQTMDDVLQDLETAVGLRPHSISTYSLEISATPMESSQLEFPPDEADKEMFHLIGAFLEQQGYRRFAQPDFARPGKECKYVLNAWRAPQQLLLGFGAGAHSHYFGGHIWANVYSVEKYMDAVNSGCLPSVFGAPVTRRELIHKYMVLGVRCVEIDKDPFQAMFGTAIEDYFASQIHALFEKGWLEDAGRKYIITKEGLWYIDNISKTFYSAFNVNEKQPWGKGLHHSFPRARAQGGGEG